MAFFVLVRVAKPLKIGMDNDSPMDVASTVFSYRMSGLCLYGKYKTVDIRRHALPDASEVIMRSTGKIMMLSGILNGYVLKMSL